MLLKVINSNKKLAFLSLSSYINLLRRFKPCVSKTSKQPGKTTVLTPSLSCLNLNITQDYTSNLDGDRNNDF